MKMEDEDETSNIVNSWYCDPIKSNKNLSIINCMRRKECFCIFFLLGVSYFVCFATVNIFRPRYIMEDNE